MSIALTVLTGEYAGKTAVMPTSTNPLELLGGFAKEDIRWNVDYDNATIDELLEWGRADMVGRILAALYHGRYVKFEHPTGTREWKLDNPPALTMPVYGEQAKYVVSEIDDVISNGGMNVYVKEDNDKGVTIGTHGTEHPIQ